MAESRSPRQPNKPDKNEVWSWVVIAILFAFAWPVGLIVLFAKLSDRKRKSGRGTQSTIITAETEDTAETAPGSAEKKSSSTGQTKKKGSSILRRTPKVSDGNANVLRNIGIVLTIIGSIVLFGKVSDYLFFLQDGIGPGFWRKCSFPWASPPGGLGLLLGSHGCAAVCAAMPSIRPSPGRSLR